MFPKDKPTPTVTTDKVSAPQGLYSKAKHVLFSRSLFKAYDIAHQDDIEAWTASFAHWSPEVFQKRMQWINALMLAMTVANALVPFYIIQKDRGEVELMSQQYQIQDNTSNLKFELYNFYNLSKNKSEISKYNDSKIKIRKYIKNYESYNYFFDNTTKRSLLNLQQNVVNFLKNNNNDITIDSRSEKITLLINNFDFNLQEIIKKQKNIINNNHKTALFLFISRMVVLMGVQFLIWHWWIQVRLREQSKEEEMRTNHEELTIMAEVDPLTGLRNRRTFEYHLTFEFERSQQQRWPLSLIMVDVDHFKKFNDAFGHLQGDEALKMAATVLLKAARKSDIVVRYGGEEFAMLLPHTSIEEAKATGERLRTIMHETDWPSRSCTASIGIATLTPDMKEPTILIDRADIALYNAKETGRDRVVHFSEMSKVSEISEMSEMGEISESEKSSQSSKAA